MSGDLVAGRHGKRRQPLEEIPQEYAAFKIEQRGIDLIPDAERKMRPSGLFWLWSGAVFNVEFFFYGTLIMTFGLSVPQAVAAILIGNLFYALLGLASLQGPKTGTTTFMVSRAPFGQNGNRMVALFNWVTQVGFEIEGIYFVVATVILLFSLHGTNLNGPAKIVVIIIAALLQMILPLLGPRHDQQDPALAGLRVHRVLRRAGRVHLQPAAPVHVPRQAGVVRGVDDRAGADHLGRRPGLDRERQRLLSLPAAQHPDVADVLVRDAGRRDPVDHPGTPGRVRLYRSRTKTVGIAQLGVPQSFPSWFVTPFLIFAIFQLLAINTIDMYSSGVTLQALGVPVRRWGAVIIDTVVCAVVTGIILFHGNFYARTSPGSCCTSWCGWRRGSAS